MKVIYWCMLVVLSPVTALATTISAYSHMEEHIQILDKTDEHEASSGMVASYVEADPLPEHYLQGNTSAQANVNGSLNVSAVGNVDLYDGVETYFTSTASWSQEYYNGDAGNHYFFNYDISDINIGSDYRAGSSNRTGYELDVSLNGSSIYDQVFIFDTTTLVSEYVAAMMAGDPNPPAGERYFTIEETAGQLDLGYFAENENFTLQYQITAFAQPIDTSSCYINFGMSGNLVAEVTPVPEPATLFLLGTGLGAFWSVGRLRWKKRQS